MSVWHTVGLAGDHTASIQSIIRDYVQSNWSLTGDLAAIKVRFGTRWYNRQNQFHIHFRHDIEKDVRKITMGSRPMYQFADLIHVHAFAEEQTDNDEPQHIDDMNREVQRIIGSNAVALESSQGICDLYIMSTPRVLPVEALDSQSTIHHSVSKIGAVYRKHFS